VATPAPATAPSTPDIVVDEVAVPVDDADPTPGPAPAAPKPTAPRSTESTTAPTAPAAELATVVTAVVASDATDQRPADDRTPDAPVITPTAATAAATPAAAPRVDTPAAPGPVAPTPPPAPPAHSQVVSHVTPLLRQPDGTHQITMHLHPEQLGGVHVEVSLHAGEVSLHLRAETEAGHAALRESLPALRAEIEAAGVSAGTLDLGDWTGGQQGAPDTPSRQQGPALPFGLDPLDPDPDQLVDTGSDAGLDVRM
jgi:flagellar hook-length control protein FliK